MKNIAFLISGNIRIYEKNLVFLESLRKELIDYKIIFICSVWEKQETLEEFSKKYQVKFINQIKENDWHNKIEKIKFVTGGENLSFKIQNVFHMWHSITENIHFLESVIKENNLSIDYVCRYRTDIMTLKGIKNLKRDLESLKNNEFLFSSNRHYRGITDLFFIAKIETFYKLKNIFNFFDKFITDKRVFDPEYIFYCFISENNFKIKIAYKLDLAIIRIEESKPTKTVFIPIKDKIKMKIAKRRIKLIKLINKFKYVLK
tara:strand:- start:3176 stop:3955 length:780 start_codon:yes stop_codon:yes gene_type:complete